MMHWLEPPEGKDLAARCFTNRAIWVLVLIFAGLAATYSVVTPLFEAPDELLHYPFVKHLADGRGLPVLDPAAPGPYRQEGGQPPLYYTLAALVTCWVPSDDLPRLLQYNPHYDSPNKIVHTLQEAWPYRGAALAVHLARLLSVGLGAMTVLFTYAIGLEIAPRRPGLALAAAAVVTFTPTFAFLSGAVTNDNLIITLATIALWQMLRLLRLPPTLGRWALLGATIGMAALTKLSGLALLPLAGAVVAWVAWRRGDWRIILRGGACIAGMAVLIAGWWYYRNWHLYHDPLALNVFFAIAGHRSRPPSLHQLLAEWPGFVRSYWGTFGWVNVAAPVWFYRSFNLLALLASAGLLVGIGRSIWRRHRPDAPTVARVGLVVSWPLLVAVSLLRYTLMIEASHGRLVFPAIAALSYLMVFGLANLLPGRRSFSGLERHLSSLPAYLAPVIMGGLALWAPFGVVKATYERPPLLSPDQQAAVPNRLGLHFGDQVQLLGYQVDREQVQPGQDLTVTLYWRAESEVDENYTVFVHLLDENGVIIAQRDVYPGRGAFPTMLWRPGDAIADIHRIRIPRTAFSPSQLTVYAGLYEKTSGRRLPISNTQGVPMGDGIHLSQVAVRAEPQNGVPNPQYFNLGNKIALVGYDLDRTALQPGETLHLTIYWRGLTAMTENYTVFAHLLGPDDSIWAQKDSWPQDGAAPTVTWQPGQVIVDRFDLVVNPETPDGVYVIEVGLYQSESLARLIVMEPDGHLQQSRVLLCPIRVARR